MIRLHMLNAAQLKTLAVFSIFAIIGFGPVSPGCLIGMFIVVARPQWFLDLVVAIYEQTPEQIADIQLNRHGIRLKAFACLLSLFIIDIAPVPVTPVVAFFIIVSRPKWFLNVVLNVYA